MRQSLRIVHALLVGSLAGSLMAACSPAGDTPVGDTPAAARDGAYIYVFAGAARHGADTAPHAGAAGDSGATDFLAVIDADSASPTYAQLVASVPIGAAGTMPHHTEMVMPEGGRALFANSFMTGRTYLFDFANPLKPRITGTLDSVPGFRMPHSFSRLADGTVLATLQFGDGRAKGNPGGIALFSADGRFVRAASSADPAFPEAGIRTYSLDVSPITDRVITTSTPMDTEATTADVVQLWRLSDLTLLRTIPFPRTSPDSTSRYPFEVRFFPDGRSAILNTYNCGFYYLSGLEGDAPTLEPVLALEQPKYIGCGVPLLIGKWWIVPVPSTHEFLVYDLTDPRKPRLASALAADSTYDAHWMSREPGSDRIVVTVETKAPSVRIARFDSTTGALAWDERFRETPGGALGVSFDRTEWPHGKGGRALPHGAVFSRGRAATP